MTTAERRTKLITLLSAQSAPISATMLARTLGVSRQIVVGDVAILRATGMQVNATPRGYILPKTPDWQYARMDCVFDGNPDSMLAELYAIVDNGGVLERVEIENRLYGRMSSEVNVINRHDADSLIEHIGETYRTATPDGRHTDVVRCRTEEEIHHVELALKKLNVLTGKC